METNAAKEEGIETLGLDRKGKGTGKGTARFNDEHRTCGVPDPVGDNGKGSTLGSQLL